MKSSVLEDNTNEPNVTTTNTDPAGVDSCAANDRIWSVMIILFTVTITIGLSFTVRRKKCHIRHCLGRPGFLQPMNFIDEVSRRWAYAACCVILAFSIMQLFLGQNILIPWSTYDVEWRNKFQWVRVLVTMLEALIVCLFYYPMMACINQRRFIAANVLGLLYLIPWIAFSSSVFYFCPIRQNGNYLAAVIYITRILIYIGFYIVGLSYVLDLVRNIRRRRSLRREAIMDRHSSNGSEGNLGYSISHHLEYVANLLRTRKPEQVNEIEGTIIQKSKQLIQRVKYDKIMGFRYSTRLVCCTTIAATLVIWIVIVTSALVEENPDINLLLSLVGLIWKNISVAKILFHVANALAGFVVLVFLLNSLITYKRRWHQLLRGDHSWHMYGTTINSPSSTLVNGLKYAGFQVAYALWGWVVLGIVLWIVLMFAAFAFIIPLKKGEINWFITLLKHLWPTMLLGIIIYVLQRLLCRFLFLQDKGSSLALDNRRLYNAASYYFLVLNVIVGFFSCLKRIVIPLVLGILFLSRLDQPLILKGFETFDPGYVSFVSMLLVDLYHNHPVVKAFVELMLKVRKQEQTFTGVNGLTVTYSEEKRRRSKLIRNRWWKTVTLANNPSLVLKVLEQRLINERRNAGQANQSPANVGDDISSTEMQPLPETMATSSFA